MLVAAVVITTIAVTGSASAAAPETSQGGERCVRPETTDDDTISILGLICDTQETPPSPVEGVQITVEDESGNEVGEATTNAQGGFEIPLPGTALDNLGKQFTLKLDEESFPEEVQLRNPNQVTRTVAINLSSDAFVAFPVGPAPGGGDNFFVEGLQLAVGGIVFSLLLALSALGLSMIFGTTGLTNFAHGELITFGALAAFALDRLPGTISIFGAEITVIVGVIAAFAVSGLFGWFQDKTLWAPLRRRGTGIIAMMIVSIGLSIFLRNVFQYFAGGSTFNYSQYASVTPWELGPILLTPKEVVIAGIALSVLVLVSLALAYTRTGKATRAVADNPALAASSGINVERVISVVWTGGAALAGLAGVLLGLSQGFDFQIGFKLLLLVFAAVVLGGLGTIWGSMVGAFIIGILIEVSTLVIPAELKYVGALVVLIAVLLVRPQGLLGKAQRVG